MLTDISFYGMSILFGISLAMDAFSVSLANGMNDPRMKISKSCGIAGLFAFFQGLMPFIGWALVRGLGEIFGENFFAVIPWIAFALLGFIGGKMLLDGIRNKDEGECGCPKTLGFGALLVQGIGTSIDAMSTGTNMSTYSWLEALVSSVIIAILTFIICVCGVEIGKKTGMLLAGKACIMGGLILILIGIYIVLKSYFPFLP